MDIIRELNKLCEQEQLNEIAEPLKSILQKIKDKSSTILVHLYKLYVIEDADDYEHWKKEIYNALSHIAEIKGKHKSKFPSSKAINKALTDNQVDKFYITLKALDSRLLKYYKNCKFKSDYDANKLLDIYTIYCNWLSEKLSVSGIVLWEEVREKLGELLEN